MVIYKAGGKQNMFFVSYRQNELFDKYVPQIMNGLPVIGTFTIPAGTEVEDSNEAFITAFTGLREKGVQYFISDRTVSPYVWENATKQKIFDQGVRLYEHKIDLDDLFSNQIKKWTANATVKENLQWFATEVSNGRQVKKIIVVTSNLEDHNMVGSDEPDARSNNKLGEWIGNQLLSHFTGAELIIVKDLTDGMIYADNENVLLVTDRHSGLKQVMRSGTGAGYHSLSNWPKKCSLLTLPLETCAAQLMDRGTFPYNFDVEDIRNEIKKEARIR